MPTVSMWLPIVRSAKEYLSNLPELAGYAIGYLGATPADPGASRVEIDFDSESAAVDGATPTPEVCLYLRVKTRSDAADPEPAMAEAYRVHRAILGGQRQWQARMLKTLGLATKITAAGLGCLGTSTRPHYVTELALSIAWRAK